MLWTILIASTVCLWWVYDGYARFLTLALAAKQFARRFQNDGPPKPAEDNAEWASKPLTMTVLLTVHNEEDVIESRIQNLLDCDFDNDRLEIFVASDGSTDSTALIVRSLKQPNVKLIETPGYGKTGTQNVALPQIKSDIVVFTDADIVFDSQFLKRIEQQFQNSTVGAVDGRLLYATDPSSSTTTSQGFYWNYELKVRELESRLGWLAVVAGACFAARRELIVPMESSIGEDCIVPLDIVQQGYQVVHDPKAIAFDTFEEGDGLTLRRRIRQTLRNWQGTWSRSSLLNPLRHPSYALALWSHKLLRWLSPVFLLAALVSSLILVAFYPSLLTTAAAVPYVALFSAAAVRWLLPTVGSRIPGTGIAFSFVLANTAFLIGVFRATLGSKIHAYKNA